MKNTERGSLIYGRPNNKESPVLVIEAITRNQHPLKANQHSHVKYFPKTLQGRNVGSATTQNEVKTALARRAIGIEQWVYSVRCAWAASMRAGVKPFETPEPMTVELVLGYDYHIISIHTKMEFLEGLIAVATTF